MSSSFATERSPCVLKEHAAIKAKTENIIRHKLCSITGHAFYNLSKFTFAKPPDGSGLNGLLDDTNQLAPNLNNYINGFSPNVRAIMERFKFGDEIATMAEKDPDHIGELTKIFGDFRDGQTRTFTEEDPVTHQPIQRQRVVSKIFDNEDFGYHKITVERPLRLNFQASAERLARLDDESGFKKLATSARKDPALRQQEIEAGQQRQEEIRAFVRTLGNRLYKDRETFLSHLRKSVKSADLRLSAPELKAMLAALGERDETADICRLPAPRPSPGQFCIYVLKCADESFYIGQTEDFPQRLEQHERGEVSWTGPRLPVTPIHWEVFATREEAVKREQDLKTGFGRKWLKREFEAGRLMATSRQAGAWIDTTKTKVGYEIPLNRHFYRYEPPRPLEVIETDIKRLEDEIMKMLKEVTA